MDLHLQIFLLFIATFLLSYPHLVSSRDLPARPLRFLQEPESTYYIVRRKPATVTCRVKYAGDISFMCGGTKIPSTSVEVVDTSKTELDVMQVFINVSRADVNNYVSDDDSPYWCECTALSLDQKTELTSRRAVIKVAYLKYKFKMQPISTSANQGEDIELICGAPPGEPKPTIMWRKNKKRIHIKANERFTLTNQGSLVISSIQEEDAGLYQCVATNVAGGRESNEVRVNVTELADVAGAGEVVSQSRQRRGTHEPVFITQPEKEYYLGENDTLTIDCHAMNAVVITSRCNGRRMNKDRLITSRTIDANGNEISVMKLRVSYNDVKVFKDNNVKNNVVYQCQCSAWYRENNWKWAYTSSDEDRGKVYLKYIDDEFVHPPSDTDAYYEGFAKLTCEPPKGNPRPTVYWLKDGERIDTNRDTNFVVLPEGALVIDYVRLQDEGTFTCVAENELGVRSSDPVTLKIFGKPTPPTTNAETTLLITSPEYSTGDVPKVMEPFFTIEPEGVNYISNSNESVTLRCLVVNAKKLLFACNNETVEESARTEFSTFDPGTGFRVLENSLTITFGMLEGLKHRDPYTCVCRGYLISQSETESGYLESRAATIQRTFLRGKFKQVPEDTVGQLGSDVELVCRPPEWVPKPTVQWIKDGFRVAESEKYVVTKEGSLIIKDIAEVDQGEYTCSAENIFRKRTSASVMVTVEASTEAEPKPELETSSGETTKPRYSSSEPEHTTPMPPKRTPFISRDLHPTYYVTKNKPASILCEAQYATQIIFNCGGTDIPSVVTTRNVNIVLLPSGKTDFVDVVKGEITVTKQDVENYDGEFYCTCQARYITPQDDAPVEEKGYIESQRGYVELAYLKKRFAQDPVDQQVYEGGFLSIACQPPLGKPIPKVSWLKDGEPLEINNLTQGALTVSVASMEDGGEYVCVAENEAAKRQSASILVEVLPANGIPDVTDDGRVDSVTKYPGITNATTNGKTDVTDDGEAGSVTKYPDITNAKKAPKQTNKKNKETRNTWKIQVLITVPDMICMDGSKPDVTLEADGDKGEAAADVM